MKQKIIKKEYRDFINSVPDAMVIVNEFGVIEFINNLAEKLFCYNNEEVAGEKIEKLIPDEFKNSHIFHRAVFFKEPGIRQMGAGLELFGARKDGTRFPLEISLSTTNSEDRILISAAVRDISERKRFFHDIPIPAWVYDNSIHRFINVNQAAIVNYGYSKEEFLTMSIEELIYNEAKPGILSVINKKAYNAKFTLWKHKKKDGTIIDVEIISHDVKVEDGRIHSVVIANDITPLINMQRKLLKAEEKYRAIFENAAEGIVQIKDFKKIIEANPSFIRMLGYKTKSELIASDKDAINDLFAVVDDKKTFIESSSRHALPFETKIYKKDGSTIWVKLTSVSFPDAVGNIILEAIVEDITSRKKSEAALKEAVTQFTNLFESLDDVVFSLDVENNNMLQLSPSCEKLTGYPLSAFLEDLNLWYSIVYPEDIDTWKEYTNQLEQGKPVIYPYRIIRKDKKVIWVECKIKPVMDSASKLIRLDGIVSDITERIEQQESIKKSLIEKETLLKEIHHRVKNNLQIISSLIKLQAVYIKDPEAKSIFLSNQHRIISIALVHQKLYQSTDFNTIDFNSYLNQLTRHIMESYGAKSKSIKTEIECEEIISLNIETAVPLGLIISELISNSIKHAFDDNSKAKIHIKLLKHADTFQFIYKDNGAGIPSQIDSSNTDSLGLQLVNTLSDQLDGKLEMTYKDGTEFSLTFNELKYNKRI
jgi:PAS domain S-box-containing protein